jgi:hypothetical protein
MLYHRPVARLFQNIAAAALGPGMLERGAASTLLGVGMHFSVAFTWSAVFLLLVMRVPPLARLIKRRTGAIAVAAVYGPCIWLTMSLLVIPLLSGIPVPITWRWWVQFFGHVPFVGVPIVWGVGGRIGPSRLGS